MNKKEVNTIKNYSLSIDLKLKKIRDNYIKFSDCLNDENYKELLIIQKTIKDLRTLLEV